MERDALFIRAAEIVIKAQQGSVALIQRKLSIGWNRAQLIIKQLEDAGIVEAFNRTRVRLVLVPKTTKLEDFLRGKTKNSSTLAPHFTPISETNTVLPADADLPDHPDRDNPFF